MKYEGKEIQVGDEVTAQSAWYKVLAVSKTTVVTLDNAGDGLIRWGSNEVIGIRPSTLLDDVRSVPGYWKVEGSMVNKKTTQEETENLIKCCLIQLQYLREQEA